MWDGYIILAQTAPPDPEADPEPAPEPESPSYTGTIPDEERDPDLSTVYDYDDQITRGVARMIQAGSFECNNLLLPEYRIDCLAAVFARASSVIERRPDYGDAGRELRDLSRELRDIVSEAEDPIAPRVTQDRRSYRAVATDKLAEANQKADAAINETVTKLLRSVGNSEKRRVHYSEIANAVGSTKIILRSFLENPSEFIREFVRWHLEKAPVEDSDSGSVTL
ncbi:hypothetical protein QW131_30305 [Roseibium salinum]|nr:hypothetical protein [Roseibium salinum]